MRYVALYDRALAEQFFKRTFRDILSCGQFLEFTILPAEIDYAANRFSDTAVFGTDAKMGSPWVSGDIEGLAREAAATDNGELLRKAEDAANRLLLMEGIVLRGGLDDIRAARRKGAPVLGRRKLARELYLDASRRPRLSDLERFVLRRMAGNVDAWAGLLSLLPGNDYLEMLASIPSRTIVLPGDP